MIETMFDILKIIPILFLLTVLFIVPLIIAVNEVWVNRRNNYGQALGVFMFVTIGFSMIIII